MVSRTAQSWWGSRSKATKLAGNWSWSSMIAHVSKLCVWIIPAFHQHSTWDTVLRMMFKGSLFEFWSAKMLRNYQVKPYIYTYIWGWRWITLNFKKPRCNEVMEVISAISITQLYLDSMQAKKQIVISIQTCHCYARDRHALDRNTFWKMFGYFLHNKAVSFLVA